MSKPYLMSSRRTGKQIDVPRRLTRYFPRPDIESQVIELLLERRRAITLVGPGGIGKTRLAQELAYRPELASSFETTFCDLTLATSEQEICEAIALALGWALSPTRAVPSLILQLKQRPRQLLILDNAEGAGANLRALLLELLPQCARVHVMTTSRTPLELEGETVIWVPPLRSDDAGPLPLDEALFRDRAQLAGQPLPDTPAAQQDLRALLRVLDGIPLAIELAAAQLRYVSMGELLQEASHPSGQLGTHPTTESGHRRALHSCFDRSWRLLALPERATLAQLSVFAGPFTAEQAEGIVSVERWSSAPAVRQILHLLVSQSLVSKLDVQTTTRYQLLRPVRDWAASKLDTLPTTSRELVLETVQVDLETGVLTPSSEQRLSEKERLLLRYLAAHPDQVVSRETLLREVWGYTAAVVSRTIDTTMQTLRKKVDGGSWSHLQTVRGQGYRFTDQPNTDAARLAVEIRHGQWHVEQAQALWSPSHFSSELRKFQKQHKSDIMLAIHRAIQRGDAHTLEELFRKGLNTAANKGLELADALATLCDTSNSATRKVLVDAYLTAEANDRVLEWSRDIPEDWPLMDRYSIHFVRGSVLADVGDLESGQALLYSLLELDIPPAYAWVNVHTQGEIAKTEYRGGNIERAHLVLHNPDHPFASRPDLVFSNSNALLVHTNLLCMQGGFTEAAELLQLRIQRAREAHATHSTAVLLGQLGALQMGEARHECDDLVYRMAKSNLEEALTLLLDLQMSVYWSLKLSELAQLYIDGEEAELAAPLLSRAEEAVSIYESFPIVKNAVAQARCSWALSCGRLDVARHALGRMAYFLEQSYTWADEVRGHLLSADYLARVGQPQDATRRLQQAEDLLDKLGCHPSYVPRRDLQRLRGRLLGADSPNHA